MSYNAEIVRGWIERILSEGRNLTKWERDFIDSIDQQMGSGYNLSIRQVEILERIYTEKVP